MAKSNKETTQQVETTEVPFDAEAFIKEKGGVSKAIRFLDSEGMERGAIAKKLNKRYQHVRNVLNQPLKKSATASE